MRYFYNPPLPVKLLFRESVWHSKTNKILITFDDGPLGSNTDKILNKLNILNIKALFFCVGNNIVRHPDLTNSIISEGHSIGNHTMNHKIISRSGLTEISEEIIPFNNLMNDKFGYKVKYFRPPHGRYSFRLKSFLKDNKFTNIMWSLLTYDYRNNINDVKRSLKYLKHNSIVVFHDNIKSSKIIIEALDILADAIQKKEFTTGTPEECLR